MIRILVVVILFALIVPALGHEDHNWTTADREWYKKQQVPGKPGNLCCNENDASEAEEDIRNGRYWTRWPRHPQWIIVPDEAVIHNPNRNGAPVVWWWHENGILKIKCYAPGGGV